MWMHPKYKHRAFTLTEILVVILILGILMSILLPAISHVIRSGLQKSCMAEIQQIEIALGLYESEHRDYPPSAIAQMGIAKENQVNSGIESLVLCFSSKATLFEFHDDKLQNTDVDISPVPLSKLNNSYFNTNELLELIDPWGNPYIYFHSNELLPTTKHYYQITGQRVEVTPYMGESKTGNIPGYGRYQIISCGPDMKLHTEDDIRSK